MRPFLYRVATDLNLKGAIYNQSRGVTAELEGPKAKLELFHQRVLENATRPILITEYDVRWLEAWPFNWQKPFDHHGLKIISPPSTSTTFRHSIQPDSATCEKCWFDFFNPESRFFNYPFVTCSECGPRWTILNRLPFERENTSYSHFTMCTECQTEYENPTSRRHHAQTMSCSACGPRISVLTAKTSGIEGADSNLQMVQKIISAGGVGLVKGLGGFQLVGDAKNPKTIARIRELKARPSKSLAIMVDGKATFLKLGGTESDWQRLSTPEAPIVSIRNYSHVSKKFLAPDLSELGVMAPTTPLHTMLFSSGVETLVVTSGNQRGFPLPRSHEEIHFTLGSEIDFIVDHERQIVHAIDDSVVRGELVLRKARGLTPASDQSKSDKNAHRLALGADLKNAVALHVGKDIIEFPYCGDLLTGPVLHAQSKNVSDFLDLFHVPVRKLEASAIDFHPETFTQELTMTQQTAVPHHIAHAWAAFHECPSDLVLTFDGTGYDENFELGGGDGFVLSEKTWHRCLQLKPVKFVGGSSSVTDPWKSLVLFFASTGMSLETLRTYFSDLPNSKIPDETLDVFYTYVMQSHGVLTTSMGRWFDAAAALIEFGSREQTYEAQAPLRLEHLAKPFQYNFDAAQYIVQSSPNEKTLVEVNAAAMLLELSALKKNQKVSVEHLAFVAHDIMAKAIAQACHTLGVKTVTGTGGVFQNELFSQLLKKHLHSMQIQFSRPTKNPVNDQSIALGQLFYLENANA